VTSAPSTYFFMHIMKTGGTSFASRLIDQFPDGSVYPPPGDDKHLSYWNFEDLLTRTPDERSNLELVHGHFPLFVGEVLQVDHVTTLLREPIARLVSHLRHLVRHDGGFPSIEAVYESPFGAHLRNYQVRQFSRAIDDDPLELEQHHLQRAIDRLDLVEVVGLTEEYDHFVHRCGERFGWTIETGPRLQVAPGEIVVDPAFLRRLEDDNEADIEFYRHAVEHRT
jgi:hypothetical protein